MDRSVLYERLRLYTTADSFYIEPRTQNDEEISAERIMVIDRASALISLQNRNCIPDIEFKLIYGIVGIIRLIAGPYLMVVTAMEEIAVFNHHSVYKMTAYDVIPYQRTTLFLTEQQNKENRRYLDMIRNVMATDGFYMSYTLDLTHTLQRLENTEPEWRQMAMNERADIRFVWNHYVMRDLASNPECSGFTLPLMHGFVGRMESMLNGTRFSLGLISRRAWHRAGTRFNVRGIDSLGNTANFVETEQIVECGEYLCAFVQTRGSIPLFWSQKPNLAWQPEPALNKADPDQAQGFAQHMNQLKGTYPGTHVIVDLVNQKGREKKVGDALRLAAHQNIVQDVIYHPFDFHNECKNMNWQRLAVLIGQLRENIEEFQFFACRTNGEMEVNRQSGYFRTNCMDCLDRTNVVQSMIARESLKKQFIWLKLVRPEDTLPLPFTLEASFKNLWADNGDMCSLQYAGTGALKSDFTRLGKRTWPGAARDGVNAVTRYVKNNFWDGTRQDAIDLFVGNHAMDDNLSPPLTPTRSLWQQVIIFLFAFALSMFILCFLIQTEYDFQFRVFWGALLLLLLVTIWYNGEEFVDKPKLKLD